MAESHDTKQISNCNFYSGYSIETTARLDKKSDSYRQLLPGSTDVMIAAPNGASHDLTIQTAIRLRKDGMNPVPHIVARNIPSLDYIETFLDKLQHAAGVDHVLLIAGDIPNPIGPYQSSMDILKLGILEARNIKKIGVSGFPEGNPNVNDNKLLDAILWKNEYAARTSSKLYICTQFVFDASPVISWEQNIRNSGNKLPIRVGVPGIASLQTLLRLANSSGVGPSVRFIKQNSSNLKSLISLATPEKLIRDIMNHCSSNQSCLIEGIHFFPFGGIEKTSRWIKKQRGL